MRLHLVLIVEVKWRNMTFKNRLRFLTLKQLVCLLESSLENAVLSAISALKWWSLKPLSSRKITKYLVSSTKRLLKSWLKKLPWPILLISCLFQLQLSFASSMTFTLSMIFLGFQRLCLGMSIPLSRERWVSLRKILTISISSPFLKAEHRLSSEITFLNMIESSDVEWKSLLWICLASTTTWLNSFAFEFLGSGWNSLPDCFTPKR